MEERLKKYDKMSLGIIVGIILTVGGFLLSYPVLTRGLDMSFSQYVNYAQHGADKQNIMIFCLLPNMFLFYFTNFRWHLNGFTKGLVGVTLLFGLLLVILTVL
jgi:hypothetical protein